MVYVIKCYLDGQEWFVHNKGARINNMDTASRFNTIDEAFEVADAIKAYMFCETSVCEIEE